MPTDTRSPTQNSLLAGLRGRFLEYLRQKRKRRAGRRWGRGDTAVRLRYTYDLGADSVVFDCGAYIGNFTGEMVKRYQCEVFCFEPLSKYFEQLSKRFAATPRVVCLNYGLGSSSREAKISIDKDASSEFRATGSAECQAVQIVDIDEALKLAGGRSIDLLKLNMEGGEFELLDAIIDRNLAARFRHIQVQFHQVVPDYHERRLKIRAGLRASHHLTYDYYFVFENWSLRPAS